MADKVYAVFEFYSERQLIAVYRTQQDAINAIIANYSISEPPDNVVDGVTENVVADKIRQELLTDGFTTTSPPYEIEEIPIGVWEYSYEDCEDEYYPTETEIPTDFDMDEYMKRKF